jgi:hypothetical protein
MKERDASVEHEWISDSSRLAEFVAFALDHDRYCVDTEFHREKTYVPQLALVQVEAGGRIVLIDTLALDAGGLEPLFSGPGTCVFHAAQQDLDVFTQVLGIFTQTGVQWGATARMIFWTLTFTGLALTVGTLLENESAAPEVMQVTSIAGPNSILVSRAYGGGRIR